MSMLRVFSVCTALILSLASVAANADQASHARNAERFLQLANADRLAVPVYAQVQQMFAQRFAETQAPENKKALLERYQAKANTALDQAIGWKKLEPELVSIYTSQFTERELAELIEFYESPLGKKMLDKLPEQQEELEWTSEAIEDEQRYRRTALVIGAFDAALFVALAGLVVYKISRGY